MRMALQAALRNRINHMFASSPSLSMIWSAEYEVFHRKGFFFLPFIARKYIFEIIWYISGNILLQRTVMHIWNPPFFTRTSRCASIQNKCFFAVVGWKPTATEEEIKSSGLFIVSQGHQNTCRGGLHEIWSIWKDCKWILQKKKWGHWPPPRWDLSIIDDHLSSLVQRHRGPFCREAQ